MLTPQNKNSLIVLGQQAVLLCEQLERGQAETPVTDHLQSVIHDLDSAPFSLVLLGLTLQSLKTTLSWLFGDDFSVIAVNNNSLPGLMEIAIAEKGFVLHNANRSQQLFDSIGPFMEALQSNIRAEQAKSLEPLRMAVSTERGAQGLKIFIPENVGLLLEEASLLNALIAEANLVVVAAPLRYTLTREDHLAIDELSRNMQAVWPLLVVDELNEKTGMPEIGWWEQYQQNCQMLTPKLLTTHVTASVPPIIADADDPTRQSLFLLLQGRRLYQAIAALTERQQQIVSMLEQKKQRQSAMASAVPAEKLGERRIWDQMRQQLDDSIAGARKTQEQAIGRFNLANASVWQEVQARLATLSLADIEQKESHSAMVFNVSAQAMTEFSQIVLRHCKLQLKELWQSWEEQCRHLATQLNQQMEAVSLGGISAAELPDRNGLYEALAERSSISINYRGEMPKRTFMNRLADGRKAIMGFSMVVMVLGGIGSAMGINLRAIVTTLAPLLFVASLLYTYIVWPKEDAEKMEKELERIRDGIRGEVKRLLGEMQRNMQTLLTEMVELQRRKWATEQKDIQQNAELQQNRRNQQARDQSVQQDQQLSQKIKAAQQILTELRQLHSAAGKLVK